MDCSLPGSSVHGIFQPRITGENCWTRIQFSSLAQSCLTLCDPMYGLQHTRFPCPSPTPRACSNSCPSSQWWLSNHLILCHPLLLLPSIFPSIRVFSSESVLHIRCPKYWSFSFSISPSNEYSGLISFRMDWLDLLAVQGTLKSLLQHHSSEVPILRHSAFFVVQISHPHMTTGKTVTLTRWTFVGRVMSLLFNMLFKLVVSAHNYYRTMCMHIVLLYQESLYLYCAIVYFFVFPRMRSVLCFCAVCRTRFIVRCSSSATACTR